MNNDKTEPSSDLQAARTSSKKLRDHVAVLPKTTAARQAANDTAYAPFSASRVVTAESPAPASQSGSQAWTSLLDRCLFASGLKAAFLTDESGLAFAHQGAIDDAQAEMLGARLAVTITQAADVSRSAGSGLSVTVAVDIGGEWVTGMSVRAPDGTTLLLGLVGAQPVAGQMRDEVLRVALRVLQG